MGSGFLGELGRRVGGSWASCPHVPVLHTQSAGDKVGHSHWDPPGRER